MSQQEKVGKWFIKRGIDFIDPRHTAKSVRLGLNGIKQCAVTKVYVGEVIWGLL